VMLRMVSVGGEMARRQVPSAELNYPQLEDSRVKVVIDRFEKARLLTSGTDSEDRPYQEPAHDALVRGWKRLLDWRREHLSAVILQRELTSDATQWQAGNKKNRDAGLLWIEDPRLPTALQLSCGKAYKDTWFNLFRWRFRYHAWQSQPHDYWFNASEADFVWQSFKHKFTRFGQTVMTLAGVILVLSGVTVYALQRAKIAQLREQSAKVLNLLPTASSAEGLVLAIDTMDQSWSVPAAEMTAQSSLLNAVQSAQEANRFQGHGYWVIALAFSPDGRRIVSGSWDETVRLWDVRTGQPIGQPLKGDGFKVTSVAFSPDGKRIVSGGWGKTLQMWNTQTGQLIGQPLRGHGAEIKAVAFSPDGGRIVSASQDKTLRLWNSKTGQSIGQPLKGHGAGIRAVVFSPDGSRIVSGSEDKTIRLWDVKTGQQIGQAWKGHGNTVKSVAFSPVRTMTSKGVGYVIASGSHDKTVRLWDAQTGQSIGQPLQGHQAKVSSVAFSSDGRRIISGSWDETIRLWDVQTSQPIGQPLQTHGGAILSVAFSPDGHHIISTGNSDNNIVRLWDAQMAQPVGQALKGHGDREDVAFSPDGSIVSTSEENTLRLWDSKTSQPIGQPLKGHEDEITVIVFSPDGRRVVSGSLDKTLRLWDTQTGQPIGQPFKGHEDGIAAVAFSSDSRRIVSGSLDKTLRLWNVQTGQPIGQPLKGHEDVIAAVAFSPDGHRIVSGGAVTDRSIRLWDIQTGQPIGQPLKGHGNYGVTSVAFSPDGRRIVSSSISDKTVRLWDAQTGQPIGQPLHGDDGKVSPVAFSPDGKRIISGGFDKTMMWDASPEGLLKIACDRLKYHPLLNRPETVTSDPEMLKVSRRSKDVCQRRVWHQQPPPTTSPIDWLKQSYQWVTDRFL
jgi:WD40 repeat protein